MIPSTWGRLSILVPFLIAIAGTLMWLAAQLIPSDVAFAQTVAALVFLLGFYTFAPLTARFLAPVGSRNHAMQCRLARIQESMPNNRPVFLYDHPDKNAYSVGIIERYSCVYLTSGLMERMSDAGMCGILAHEETHSSEHHLLITFSYAACYALLAHVTASTILFVAGFFGIMLLRRYMEYRADAGAARMVSIDAMLAGLNDLEAIYPPKRWSRWLVPFLAYPTLPMRIRALRVGRRPLF